MPRGVSFLTFVLFISCFSLLFFNPFFQNISIGQDEGACVKCHTDAKLIDRLTAEKARKEATAAAG